MFRVENKLFVHEEDANNYRDYLKNGLKIVRKSCEGWLFNDGSILFDVAIEGMTTKKYTLKQGNKLIKSERLLKKYIAVLE